MKRLSYKGGMCGEKPKIFRSFTCIKSSLYYNGWGKAFNNNIVVIFLTYEEVCNYIEEIPKFTVKHGLAHTGKLLSFLGDPQRKFAVIHVAGSNGKGSVCSAISHVLKESGKRTGLFISPHLVCMEERMQINEKNCTKEQFVDSFLTVKAAVERMEKEGDAHPSFFEYLFAMAMVFFAKEQAEVVVLETGLGGRLDATNVVEKPLLTVITSISLEHTEYLGDTITAIAGEKAGIIKEGVPVVFDGSSDEAAAVIRKKAEEKHAPFYEIRPEQLEIHKITLKNIDFSFDSRYDDVIPITIPFVAEYQVMNMALAYQALALCAPRFALKREQILRSLCSVRWAGRMQQVSPEVYFDGAHNTAGIREFLKTVRQIGGEKPLLLFSMVKEKDYARVVQMLAGIDWGGIIVTHIPDARGLSVRALQEEFLKNGKETIGINECRAAYDDVMQKKEQGQMVFCTGSLYLIGELEKIAGGLEHDRF